MEMGTELGIHTLFQNGMGLAASEGRGEGTDSLSFGNV